MKTCVLILDNIRSVENAGSMFRTAECLGVSKIILVGTTPTPLDRFGRKRQDFAKVALGAEEIVEWEYVNDASETIQELKDQNFEIISLEQHENSLNLKEFKPQQNFALVIGNEVTGVSKEILANSDAIVEIEMKGEKESMNASVAAGIALFMLL